MRKDERDAKDLTRSLIVAGAEKAFLEKGLFAASMGDVALAAGLTRRTLYRYFASKEALAFEVTCGILERWNSQERRIWRDLRGDGLARVEAYLADSARYLSAHPDIMKLLGEFDFYFKDDNRFAPERGVMKRYREAMRQSDDLLRELFAAGIEDGSIDPGIDPELAVVAISNVLWVYGQRIAARRRHLRAEFGRDPMDLVRCQIELSVRGLAPGAAGRQTRRAGRGGRA